MTVELAPGWTTELDRGPDWLFVRLKGPSNGDAQGSELADRLCQLLEQQLAHRLCLELDDLPVLRSALVGEIIRLNKRIRERGGVLRLCGLSEQNHEVLRVSQLDRFFPRYDTRHEAVLGYHRPSQPR